MFKLNPCFLTSHLISHLSYMRCEVRVESPNPELTHFLGYCRYTMVQYGRLFVS